MASEFNFTSFNHAKFQNPIDSMQQTLNTTGMKMTQILVLVITLGLLSCNNNRTESSNETESAEIHKETKDTTLKIEQKTMNAISDSNKRLVVDGFPVKNEMFVDKAIKNSSHKMRSGKTYSYDKVWFRNDTINQTLVFELYTDFHRMLTYHFYNNDMPSDLIKAMELHTDGGDLATESQKLKDFGGFINQSSNINSSYFTTEKGFRLGDAKQKAIETYGKPQKQTTNNGIEKLEWNFIGDQIYEGKVDLKGKPLAKNSFGHNLVMYFKDGKLIGQILHNDIP